VHAKSASAIFLKSLKCDGRKPHDFDEMAIRARTRGAEEFAGEDSFVYDCELSETQRPHNRHFIGPFHGAHSMGP